MRIEIFLNDQLEQVEGICDCVTRLVERFGATQRVVFVGQRANVLNKLRYCQCQIELWLVRKENCGIGIITPHRDNTNNAIRDRIMTRSDL